MAIPTFQAAGTAVTSTGAALSVPWPVGHTTNDIGILVIESSGGSAAQGAIVGWTEIYPSPLIDVVSAAGSIFQVFWKRAASAAEANVATAIRTDHQLARIYGFTGCVTTGSPINTSDGAIGAASSTVTADGLTTYNANCLIAVFASRPNDSAATNHFSSPTNASLGTVTARGEAGTIDGDGGGFTCITGTKAAAGAVSPTTISKGTSNTWVAYTVALCDTVGPALLANQYFGVKV